MFTIEVRAEFGLLDVGRETLGIRNWREGVSFKVFGGEKEGWKNVRSCLESFVSQYY